MFFNVCFYCCIETYLFFMLFENSCILSIKTHYYGATLIVSTVVVIESLLISVADVTTTASSSLTTAAVSSESGPVTSKEISLLPSSHRVSAYRSKYLQQKEQQQEELSSQPSRDSVSTAASDQKDGSLNCHLWDNVSFRVGH